MEFLAAVMDLFMGWQVARESSKDAGWSWGVLWALMGMIVAMGGLLVFVVLGPLPQTHPRVAVGLLAGGGVAFLVGLAVTYRRVTR